MPAPDEGALLAVVDRIYESVEHPAIWPDTVYAIGELVGGRRAFWGIDPDVEINPDVNRHMLRAGAHAFFLSRGDLQALDQYVDEFGELIARVLQISFLRTLWPHVSAEPEIIGRKISERYLATVEPVDSSSLSPLCRPAVRKLVAAIWEDGSIFSAENLRCMRLI